ncbi:hypothetical protein QFC20_000396 [Naganishia adeliensis]|uniref:Uncharacterized protein n=1 Tax=Naganishia adeliensis TaxID=92952 RepID=A0ACC2X2G9_9TREE|nr:hypothetical protein QFC20_000396 [Naganishia adeliensis]
MCCQAKWKREAIPDHKFDFIDTADFHMDDWFTRFRYAFVYIFLLKDLAVIAADIYTATTMIASSTWTNVIYKKCGNDCAIKIPFDVAKWVFVGCIIFGFLLIGWESWKARKVIRSRDIAFAFTNVMANDYLSLKSYDTFCFFCQISNSTKKKDEFAFFCFFTFKGWKRLLLSDGPRQAINACTLYSFAYANNFQTHDLHAYWDNSISTLLLLLAMIGTVLLFVCSLLLLLVGAICYVPLVCYIQGNLKEYCCHKIDKRIAELLRHRQRLRVREQLAFEKQLGDEGILKDKNGKVIKTMALPTLPTLDFTEEDEDTRMRTERSGKRKSIARFARSLSRKAKKRPERRPGMGLAAHEAGVGLPPMSHAASPYSEPHDAYPLQQGYFGRSTTTDDPYGSQVNLAGQAAPFAGSYDAPAYPQLTSPYAEYPATSPHPAHRPIHGVHHSSPRSPQRSLPYLRDHEDRSNLAYDHSINEPAAVYQESIGRQEHAWQQHQQPDWAPQSHHPRSRPQPF